MTTNTRTTINISKLNKAAVLAALYNASFQQGMGIMHQRGARTMTVEEAQQEIDGNADKRCYFDYLHGRVMKIEINPEAGELYTGLYNRDNGEGAAERALQSLLA